jgi:ribosomal protein S2
MLIKISVSAADEWAIHKRAVEVVFAQQANLGSIIHYNSKLNNHERVTEYAESLGAEMAVARYFGLRL